MPPCRPRRLPAQDRAQPGQHHGAASARDPGSDTIQLAPRPALLLHGASLCQRPAHYSPARVWLCTRAPQDATAGDKVTKQAKPGWNSNPKAAPAIHTRLCAGGCGHSWCPHTCCFSILPPPPAGLLGTEKIKLEALGWRRGEAGGKGQDGCWIHGRGGPSKGSLGRTGQDAKHKT